MPMLSVVPSRYEKQSEQLLSAAQKKGATSAEVSIAITQGVSLTVREQALESLEYNRGHGLTLTVYLDQKQGTATSTDFSEASLKALLEKACVIAEHAEPDPFAGLADPALLAKHYPDLDLYHPWEFSVPDVKQQLMDAEKAGLSCDSRIKQSEGISLDTHQGFSVYANTNGFLGSQFGSEHYIQASFVAEMKGQMQRDDTYAATRNAKELPAFSDIANLAAERSVQRLNARRLRTQKSAIIFSERVARGLWSSFINAISGGNLYRHTSFLVDSLGKAFFPKFIQVYQRPHLKGALGSSPFDSEGVATRDLDFVKDGKIMNYVMGSYSARKLGLQSQGNADGVHNLIVQDSGLDFSMLLKKMGKGFLVTELMGQGINLVTGDYSRGASGFWVENGEIQFPVHEVTLAGNLKEMFANVLAISNDVKPYSNIFSGSVLIEEMMIGGT